MKKRLAIALIAATLLAAGISGCGCENKAAKSTPDEAATPDTVTTVNKITDTTETTRSATIETTSNIETQPTTIKPGETATSPTQPATAKSDKPGEKSEGQNGNGGQSSNAQNESGNRNNNNSGNTGNNNSGAADSGYSDNQTNNNNNSNQNNDPHAGKTWHEAEYEYINHPAEYAEVKVVDREAYTYEEPIYVTHTYCNYCGADISDNITAHLKEHMLNGVGGGYHSEDVQVGTQTITVPEVSHMETVLVKEAWTEKKLIREAGWY